jgi:acetylornithine aminotransferase
MQNTLSKEELIRQKLNHKLIKEIRGVGLMLCLIMNDAEVANKLVLEAKNRGLILFWLLIEKRAVRITPPLTILEKEIEEGCDIVLNILDTI